MHQLLFKNRFNALVFVAMILFSVPLLVGTDGERGAIETATERFGGEPSTNPLVQAQAQPSPRVVPPQAEVTFTPDEELVDETEGFDPSGDLDEPGIGEASGYEGPGFEAAPVETAEVQPDTLEG